MNEARAQAGPQEPWAQPFARLQADLDEALPGLRLERDGDDGLVATDSSILQGTGLPEDEGDEEARTYALASSLLRVDVALPRCPVHRDAAHGLVPKLTRALGAAWACAEENRALVSIGRLHELNPPVRALLDTDLG